MDSLENVIGYTFRDKNLLAQAMTHASLGYETQRSMADNQRLEFLGDAVIQLLLSHTLFTQFPQSDEGTLTKARAQIVSTPSLARLAQKLNLGQFLRLGKGEESNGGRDRSSTLCDALEAIIGAIYLDGGLEQASAFAKQLFAPEVAALRESSVDGNPKGSLQELIQAVSDLVPSYKIISASGPDHAREFEAQIEWNGAAWGHGQGRSKKEAEVRAAENALKNESLLEALRTLNKP